MLPGSSHLRRFAFEMTPRWIFSSTALLLLAGFGAFLAWWRTGNPFWIRAYFYYPGALFFIACGLVQAWLSYLCWRQFSSGDRLRPAWFLILLAGVFQLLGGLLSHILGSASGLNPFSYFSAGWSQALTGGALAVGRCFGPLQMALLAYGLWIVLRACRAHGVLGRLKPVDYALLAIVVVYTVQFLSDLIISPAHRAGPVTAGKIIGWTSDPLLCILLFEAILVRRSAANMGWGLISRCWISFTAAIFLTSLGDIGLWASAYWSIPYGLEVASWYVWFVASAAYVLGPAYQLQATFRATYGHAIEDERQLSYHE